MGVLLRDQPYIASIVRKSPVTGRGRTTTGGMCWESKNPGGNRMAPANEKWSTYSPTTNGGQYGHGGRRAPDRIPEVTIEAIARSLSREAQRYGFQQGDYLRLVNHLLDLSGQGEVRGRQRETEADPRALTVSPRLPLDGNGIRIRAFDAAGDRALLARWLDDTHGRFFLLSSVTAKTLDIDEVLRSDQNILGVIVLPDATPIGMMAFLDVDRWQQKAELRKLIGEPQYRGRGYARQGTALWIHYGLHGLGLKKIYLNTLQTNMRNIRLNEALGFRVEGILRKEFFLDGEHHDVLRMALLKE
jgi:diamine N-acetyltransferase